MQTSHNESETKAVCGLGPVVTSVRRGVTLIEILLVLAILVALAGLAAPTIESMITSRRLGNAIDQLANDLAEARVQAIRTGQAQIFKATLNGREYSISPWVGANDEIDASAGATVTNSLGMTLETEAIKGGGVATSVATGEIETKELPEGTQFLSVETLIDARNAAAIQAEGGNIPVAGASRGASSFSDPVLLYPDGSSTTVQISMIDQKGRRMVIQLRGVVGQMKKFQISSVDPSMFLGQP